MQRAGCRVRRPGRGVPVSSRVPAPSFAHLRTGMRCLLCSALLRTKQGNHSHPQHTHTYRRLPSFPVGKALPASGAQFRKAGPTDRAATCILKEGQSPVFGFQFVKQKILKAVSPAAPVGPRRSAPRTGGVTGRRARAVGTAQVSRGLRPTCGCVRGYASSCHERNARPFLYRYRSGFHCYASMKTMRDWMSVHSQASPALAPGLKPWSPGTFYERLEVQFHSWRRVLRLSLRPPPPLRPARLPPSLLRSANAG